MIHIPEHVVGILDWVGTAAILVMLVVILTNRAPVFSERTRNIYAVQFLVTVYVFMVGLIDGDSWWLQLFWGFMAGYWGAGVVLLTNKIRRDRREALEREAQKERIAQQAREILDKFERWDEPKS